MVVTRKSSNSPMPPTSRTSSSQALPRVNRTKPTQKSTKGPEVDHFLMNGDDMPEIAELAKDEFLEPAESLVCNMIFLIHIFHELCVRI